MRTKPLSADIVMINPFDPASLIVVPVVVPVPEAEPVLVDYPEAARLLGISLGALEKRVARNRVPGIVRTGRRIQFRLDVLRNPKVSR
jgi:hypothetical protein